MSETFSVVVTGKIAANFEIDQVKANVGRLFKLNEAQLKKIFCGKPIALQRGITKERAAKLRSVLVDNGALAVVKVSKSLAKANRAAGSSESIQTHTRDNIVCPRCAHEQSFATACGLCKMDLSLHIKRLKRRDQVRQVYLQRQAQAK